ncbi:MAG: hypothetical protein AB7P03_02775 [Kofleriaceae bacterium]
MRNLRGVLAVLAAPLAACGSDNNAGIDAPVLMISDAPVDMKMIDAGPIYDFSCLGNEPPAGTAKTVTVSGLVRGVDIMGLPPMPVIEPLAGAQVEVCIDDCEDANQLDTTTTIADGTFASDAIATTGTPPSLDAYLRLSKTMHRTMTIYPPSPFIADVGDLPGALLTANAFMAGEFLLGVNQNDTINGVVALGVTDCANTPILDAMVTVTQNGTAVGEVIDAGGLGAMYGGAYLVFNVPAGETEVGAMYNGMTLRAHTINVVNGATAATQVRPGY